MRKNPPLFSNLEWKEIHKLIKLNMFEGVFDVGTNLTSLTDIPKAVYIYVVCVLSSIFTRPDCDRLKTNPPVFSNLNWKERHKLIELKYV